jgi:phosphomannomutase
MNRIEEVLIKLQSIINYLKKHYKIRNKKIFIGYSKEEESIKKLISKISLYLSLNNITPIISLRPTPIPIIAHQIFLKRYIGGLLVYKDKNDNYEIFFLPEYAGPPKPDIIYEINNQSPISIYSNKKTKRLKKRKIHKIDPIDEYIKFLLNSIKKEKFKRAGLRIMLNYIDESLYGYLDEILLELGCDIFIIKNISHNDFYLKMKDMIKKGNRFDIGLTIKSNGELLMAYDEKCENIKMNELFSILYYYFINNKKLGNVARTPASTHLVDTIAIKHGCSSIEVNGGFEEISEILLNNLAVFGGDEEGGFSSCYHIPIRDAMYSSLILIEALCDHKLSELCKIIKEKYGITYWRKRVIKSNLKINDIFEKINKIKELYDLRIKNIKKFPNGFKIILEEDNWIFLMKNEKFGLIKIFGESYSQKIIKEIMNEIIEYIKN